MRIDLKGHKRSIFLVLIILFAIVLPFVIESIPLLHLLILVWIYIILASGFRLIMSTGLVSFAHASFWGIGAYATVLLVMRTGLNFWPALILGGVIAAVAGGLLIFPAMKVKRAYFFLYTFALAQLITWLTILWVELTNGISGIAGIPRPDPISVAGYNLQIRSHVSFYYFGLFLTLVSLFVMSRLHSSRMGKVFEAIRVAESLARSLGVNPPLYKMLVFVNACFFAGLSGGLYASYMQYVSPEFFDAHASLDILIYCVVGGTSGPTGPVIGTAIMIVLGYLLRVFKHVEPLVSGLILILVLIFLPKGLISLPGRIREFFAQMGIYKKGSSAN
jgi:branched-chain amino acid transport system permease protein